MFGYLITLPLLLVASEASFLRTLHDEADATSERGNVLFYFIRLTFFKLKPYATPITQINGIYLS